MFQFNSFSEIVWQFIMSFVFDFVLGLVSAFILTTLYFFFRPTISIHMMKLNFKVRKSRKKFDIFGVFVFDLKNNLPLKSTLQEIERCLSRNNDGLHVQRLTNAIGENLAVTARIADETVKSTLFLTIDEETQEAESCKVLIEESIYFHETEYQLGLISSLREVIFRKLQRLSQETNLPAITTRISWNNQTSSLFPWLPDNRSFLGQFKLEGTDIIIHQSEQGVSLTSTLPNSPKYIQVLKDLIIISSFVK